MTDSGAWSVIPELSAALLGAVVGSVLAGVVADQISLRRTRRMAVRTFTAILDADLKRLVSYRCFLVEEGFETTPEKIVTAPPELLGLPPATDISIYGNLPEWLLAHIAIVDAQMASFGQHLAMIVADLGSPGAHDVRERARLNRPGNVFFMRQADALVARVTRTIEALRAYASETQEWWPNECEVAPRGFEGVDLAPTTSSSANTRQSRP